MGMRRGIEREMGSAAVGAAPPGCCVPGRAHRPRCWRPGLWPRLWPGLQPRLWLAPPARLGPVRPQQLPQYRAPGRRPAATESGGAGSSPGAELQRGQCLAEKISVNAFNCVLGQASGLAAWLAARLIENNTAVLFLLVAISFCRTVLKCA